MLTIAGDVDMEEVVELPPRKRDGVAGVICMPAELAAEMDGDE